MQFDVRALSCTPRGWTWFSMSTVRTHIKVWKAGERLLHAHLHSEKCACVMQWEIGSEAEGMWPAVVRVAQSRTLSKCTQDGVTVLLELCMRLQQIDSVNSSRDRIALRDVFNMRAFCGCTRRRFEPTHGDVLNLHTEGLSLSLFLRTFLVLFLCSLLSCRPSQQR